jgi:hypothetical protein
MSIDGGVTRPPQGQCYSSGHTRSNLCASDLPLDGSKPQRSRPAISSTQNTACRSKSWTRVLFPLSACWLGLNEMALRVNADSTAGSPVYQRSKTSASTLRASEQRSTPLLLEPCSRRRASANHSRVPRATPGTVSLSANLKSRSLHMPPQRRKGVQPSQSAVRRRKTSRKPPRDSEECCRRPVIY